MPDIFFNPYPGAAQNLETGKKKFIATAEALNKIRNHIDEYRNPESDIPVRAFTLVRDSDTLINYRIEDVVRLFQGRQREIARLFIHFFSRGQVVTDDILKQCDGWCLSCLDVPAPVLEYALKNNGIAASIATECEWESDFINFKECNDSLPNIWGQPDLSAIEKWLYHWNKRYLDNVDKLRKLYSIEICDGALQDYFPAPSEWNTIYSMVEKAIKSECDHDGYQVKIVDTLSVGALKQLKHLGSGLRIYMVQRDFLLLCGIYKKNQGGSKAQNKAIKRAGERVENYLTNANKHH